MNRLAAGFFVALVVLGASTRANAGTIPLLQLDMQNGSYNTATQTIVAPDGSFTLYALLTPTAGSNIAALLDDVYYVSIGVTPQVKTPTNLGSFTFGEKSKTQSTYRVTEDMTYGTPPIEQLWLLQGADSGDLTDPVYPTYFTQVAFKFSAAQKTLAYDTKDTATKPDPTTNAAGTAYYVAFTGNSSLLSAGYDLHFDLFDTKVSGCVLYGLLCDIDVNNYAPFNHDAETYGRGAAAVPEPASLLLVGTAVSAFAVRRRKARRA